MPTEYVKYFGVRMIVKRRFDVDGVAKIELFNPRNNKIFILNESELKQ